MARYKLLVITNAVPGKEAAFNDWYDRRHIPDVLQVPGFVSAQRFRVSGESTLPGPYIAIYDLETEDPSAVLAELGARAGTAKMPLSDALDMKAVSASLLTPL